MQTLKSILNQLALVWKDSTAAARLGIGTLLFVFAASIIGIGIWSAQPNYVVLAEGLTPAQTAKMVDALALKSINYEIKGAGSIIVVDKQSWASAKVAIGNLGIESAQRELMDPSPWLDPVSQQNILRRNDEISLAQSIEKFENVDWAEVHLSSPKKQVFLREKPVRSAAVVVKVAPGRSFTDSHAQAIVRLVARSVSDLSEEQVTITDTQGHAYFTNDENTASRDKNESFRLLRERKMKSDAYDILKKILGEDNYSVAISVDLSFPSGSVTSTEYDPDKIAVQSTESTETETMGDSVAAGLTGTDSNVNATNSTANLRTKPVTKSITRDQKNAVSSVTRSETISGVVVNNQTVSVLINRSALPENSDEADIKKRVESLVGRGLGIKPERDELVVELFAFVEKPAEVAPAAAPIPWDQINNVLKNVSLGIAALVAGFIAFGTFRRFSVEPLKETETASTDAQISELSDMVKQYPEVFTKIVASWSSMEANDGDSTQSNSRAA